MLLSLLSRESMTRLSVSWQKGHFIGKTEDGRWRIENRDSRFSILYPRSSILDLIPPHPVRIDGKFFAQLTHLIRARNTSCTEPGCGRPAARYNMENTTDYDQGGQKNK
jgi:hypothetical protein